jgi:flagellar biogenesis protein FliO
MFYQIVRCRPGSKRLTFGPLLLAAGFLLPGSVLAQASAVAASSTLPFKQDAGGIDFPAGGGILLFFLMAAVLLCFIYAGWRRKGSELNKSRWLAWLPAPAPSAELKVTASTRLAGRSSLHVVEWEGGKLLVACGEQGVVRLAEMPPAIGSASAVQDRASGDLS